MKLGKMKMPSKAEKYDIMGLDESADASGENELASESEAEGDADMSPEKGGPESKQSEMLAGVSDDELLAELKKRGLESKLEESEEEAEM